MSYKNSNNKFPPPNFSAYIFKRLTKVCHFCKTQTDRKTIIGKNRKIITDELSICPKCKKIFITYNLYCRYKNKIRCLNPEEIQNIKLNSTKIKTVGNKKTENVSSKEKGEKEKEKKTKIYNLIYPELIAVNKPTADLFEKHWYEMDFSIEELGALIVAYIVQVQAEYKLIFVSKKAIAKKIIGNETIIINGSKYEISRKLLVSQLAGYNSFDLASKLYNIDRTIVLNKPAYNSELSPYYAYYRIRINDHLSNSGISRNVNNHKDQNRATTVYVYFRLTNTCVKNNHSIESVTAETVNVMNNQPVDVNVFYCRECNKYFINFEALQSYFTKRIYPALRYSFNSVGTGTLKEASELMLYGYNVKEGNLTKQERKRILEWIIDSGLLSKNEIIRQLQFNASFIGSKPGNERAREKWLDDIQFVSRYVKNNRRSIRATFIFRE